MQKDYLQAYDNCDPINIKGGKFWSCNIAIKKNIFLEIKGFDENFPYAAMEDVDFYLRVKSKSEVFFIRNAFVIHPWRVSKPFSY